MRIDIDLSTSDVVDKAYRPTLADVHTLLRGEIVGEEKTTMAIFCAWVLGEKPIFVAGPRASGKTHTTEKIRELIGNTDDEEPGMCIALEAGSEKNAWYQMEEINKARYLLIREYNKLPKEVKELLKDFGEEKPARYDVTVLNQVSGRRSVEKKILYPKPFCFCMADEDEASIDEQLYSRLTIIRMDASEQQNRKVLEYQAARARGEMLGSEGMETQKKQLKAHLLTLPPLSKYQFINPASDLFVDAIPKIFTDSRRDFPKLLATMAGVCRFHWKNRIQGNVRGKHTFFVTPQDMWLGHYIFADHLIESALKCTSMERMILQTLSGVEFMHKEQIQKAMRGKGITISSHMLNKHLGTMADVGYVEKSEFQGSKASYRASDLYSNFTSKIDWGKVIDECSVRMQTLYPAYAQDYSAQFLAKPFVIHPFTGQQIDLLTVGSESHSYGIQTKQKRSDPSWDQGLSIEEEKV